MPVALAFAANQRYPLAEWASAALSDRRVMSLVSRRSCGIGDVSTASRRLCLPLQRKAFSRLSRSWSGGVKRTKLSERAGKVTPHALRHTRDVDQATR